MKRLGWCQIDRVLLRLVIRTARKVSRKRIRRRMDSTVGELNAMWSVSGWCALRSGLRLVLAGFATFAASGLGAPDPSSSPTEAATGPEPHATVERLIDEGELAAATAALERRIAAEGETARNLLLRGLILYRLERYEDALIDLRQSFSLDETDPNASKALGLCLVKLGREDLAETFFRIAARLSPNDHMAHYYLGLNAYTTKRFDQAVEAFEKAASLEPGSVDTHGYLGRSHEALGNVESAGRHYATANHLNRLQNEPSAEPPLLLGSMLYRQSELSRAERLLKEALKYNPASALAHYWLGLLLERRSEIPPAIRALNRAAALDPSDHRPHYALSRIHRRAGDLRSARAAVRRFRELRARSEIETF